MLTSIFLALYFTVFGIQKGQESDLGPAILLVSSLPGTPSKCPSEDEFPAIRKSVQKFCIDIEILDGRETSYIFNKRSDFESDLNLLRRRYHEYKDAPRLADAERFPERKLVNDLITFNRSFRKNLVEKSYLEQDRTQIYQDIMIETDRLYKVWDLIRDTKCSFYYVTVRRQALYRLKEILGDEDYNLARLPPNVPIWRFEER